MLWLRFHALPVGEDDGSVSSRSGKVIRGVPRNLAVGVKSAYPRVLREFRQPRT
jgi:hypothetical protein